MLDCVPGETTGHETADPRVRSRRKLSGAGQSGSPERPGNASCQAVEDLSVQKRTGRFDPAWMQVTRIEDRQCRQSHDQRAGELRNGELWRIVIRDLHR